MPRKNRPVKCDLHQGLPPRKLMGKTLVCDQCGGRIPASAAATFEGSDYVRHFCGRDCLAGWCAGTGKKQR